MRSWRCCENRSNRQESNNTNSHSFHKGGCSYLALGGRHMENKTFIQSALTIVATLFHFLFGGWTLPLKVLLTFMVFDYISGVCVAWKKGEIDSRVGYRGIAKKVGLLMLVSMAHLLDLVFNLDPPMIQTVTVWWYIANEGFSIMENAAMAGWPVPPPLVNVLKRVKERSENEQLPIK